MKKILQRIITVLGLATLVVAKTIAQDPHYTQYNNSPMLLNPALAGLNAGDYRVYANFRTQWMTVSKNNTYRSFAGGADVAIGKITKYNSFAGLGLSFNCDQAGDIHLNANRIDLTFAYHIMLNHRGTQQLSAGLQGGFNIRTIDPSRAVFDSQWDPSTGTVDPNGARETFGRTKVMFGDAGFGLLYSGMFHRGTNIFLGFGINHLNQPKISFQPSGIDRNGLGVQRLAMKITVHGGASIPAGDRVAVMPNFLVLYQGGAYEFNLGCHVRTALGNIKTGNTALYFGAQYRGLLDAVILSTRLDVKGFTMGFSYDVNISKLVPASKTVGAPEISLMYQGSFKKVARPGHCPRMW